MMSASYELVEQSLPDSSLGITTFEGEEFISERILDSRYDSVEDKLLYLVKWRGLTGPMMRTSWEPKEKLMEGLVSTFEASQAHTATATNSNNHNVESVTPYLTENNDHPVGFARGLVAEEILGATLIGNEVCFLVRWEGEGGPLDIVPAKEANQECPQVVIRYYEERIKWPLEEGTYLNKSKD